MPRRKPRPVAKQLESPVEAAARGPKGTEVWRSRKRKKELCAWPPQLERPSGVTGQSAAQPSLVESLDQWPSMESPVEAAARGPKVRRF